ncbi:thiol:disulfide interchange protein [Acinetobacter sp. LoGeW2-3]|uniref:protein-disulfide reductase DsbD n=1 Tax=Acinetobacter sp. LoGeW2-3 TaxID=1808001 RepID=UPI000C05BCE2|nr:protein-disulfide reductase DsbD [Acinetobacter sp. LoGeW2-3]ATO19015.1 thiol:disulfide interchange protein [Acinetobacter sp. LoGeW2-3]
MDAEKLKAWSRSGSRILFGSLLLSCTVQAEAPLLPPEQAFPFTVISTSSQQAELSWDIPDNYYIYQHKVEVQQGGRTLQLDLPPAEDLHDDNYGQTQVYYQQLQLHIPTQASQTYQVTWQGCAKDRLCYPPQSVEFKTDLSGLVQYQPEGTGSKRLLDLSNSSAQQNSLLDNSSEPAEAEPTINNTKDSSFAAKDQKWSEKLAESSLGYGLLLFFGLGMLLAFTPCSLPMLPILTSLIVRDRRGIQAWMIALSFVTSMAMVYAVLGLIASSAGLNFQRWLQQPATLIAFSLLFVAFALNLFGLFEIKLPQRLVHRLDQVQAMQQGGTLVSASIMGMVSALLVGPCMTAPLAGALLFISQTQSQWQGALLLFTLGFGMGTPLLLASVLGSRVLPRAGHWMNQVKVLFAFIMLALALYFIRPLLSEAVLQWLSLGLGLSFVAYILARLFWKTTGLRWLYIICLAIAMPYIIYSQYQHSQRFFIETVQQQANWHVAETAADFEQLLATVPKGQQVIVDVYADWCVACQPIEHRVLKSAKVQQALTPYFLIKLDLSHYDATHQSLLNQWEILGPPTYLFLNDQQQEIRGLRLTGAFTENELLAQLQRFAQAQ